MAAAIRTGAKLTIAGLLLIVLLWAIDWRQTLFHLTRADPLWTGFAFVVLCVSISLSALRWQRLVRLVAPQFSLGEATRVYWIGFFFNNLLPAGIGGDIVRTAATRAHGGVVAMAAIILVERITGLAVLLALAALAIGMQARPPWMPAPPWLLAFALLGAALLLLGLLFHAETILRPFGNRLGSIGRRLVATAETIRTTPQLRQETAITFLLSILFYASLVLAQYAQLRAVGSDVAWLTVMMAVPAIALVSSLPISIGAIGVAESVFVVIYVQAGMAPEIALAAALLRRILLIAAALIGAVLFVNRRWSGAPSTVVTAPAKD